MDCPNCKLVNPPTATRCDCGYDFETRTIQASYLTERDKQFSLQKLGVAGVILGMLFGLEFVLRLTGVAVAKHSWALGISTVILAAVFFRLYFWNGRAARR